MDVDRRRNTYVTHGGHLWDLTSERGRCLGTRGPWNILLTLRFVPRALPTLKAERAGRLPPFMLQEFEKHGHTYTQRVNGQLVVLTRSPANLRTICKYRFKGAKTVIHLFLLVSFVLARTSS